MDQKALLPAQEAQIRETLERVLTSPAFCKSEQCQKFLRYVVEHHGEPLKDQPITFHERTRSFQRDMLRRELLAHNWVVAAVAKRLDLTRAHVYNLIQQFELSREAD